MVRFLDHVYNYDRRTDMKNGSWALAIQTSSMGLGCLGLHAPLVTPLSNDISKKSKIVVTFQGRSGAMKAKVIQGHLPCTPSTDIVAIDDSDVVC